MIFANLKEMYNEASTQQRRTEIREMILGYKERYAIIPDWAQEIIDDVALIGE